MCGLAAASQDLQSAHELIPSLPGYFTSAQQGAKPPFAATHTMNP
jgi:hypothetical protein